MKKVLLKFLLALIVAETLMFLISYLYACVMITDEIQNLSITVTDNIKHFFELSSTDVGTIRKEFLFKLTTQSVAFGIAIFLYFKWFFKFNKKHAGATKSKQDTYGNSQIADDKEIAPLKKDNGNYLLGKHKRKYVYQPNRSKMNRHVLINAPTASGKTTAYSIPNIKKIADRGESFVSTDTKGDTYNATAKYLKSQNYKVRVINLIDKKRSDAINPFDYITSISDAQNFVDSFLKSTGTSSSDESYWDRAEALYMSTLVLYVIMHFEKEYRNIPNWINLYLNIGDDVDKRNALFDKITDEKDVAKRSYDLYKVNTSTKVESSILLGISSRMQYFLDEDTESLLAQSDFEYADIVNEKTALFIITQERDVISSIVSSVIMTQTIDKLIEYADELPDLSYPKPIHLMMDEFANIAKLKAFAKTLTTIRAKNIIMTAIVQELNQIKVKYGEDYNTILSSFDTKILMGTTDTDTIDYFVKLGGQYTADIYSDNVRDEEHSKSTRIGQINVLNSSLVRQLDVNNELIAFIRSHNPMFLKRTYYFEEKEFKGVLEKCYWHDIAPKKHIVNYKSLNLEIKDTIMDNEHVTNQDLVGLDYEDEPPINVNNESNNFKGFGKW
ncbi:type IV secretory system conjugative DNA transfer family protein [Staphylococcus pseudintermedius]|uniref:VirD4-like conjugal transfer protein, CD1115 family n=1 Tax=Staphylococcus pseudintermedius TaxID=283734 RepID=UPI001933BCCB|nr:type IV secretory system conjugative DNA transfer family protein [Staphylococcus pseudintermedius]EGQ3202928.1 type IV secretory system conjugative DNA transfer family protein [Staphylococcus pseudintermedius]EGQ4117993.1 TraM recognition domain-containing protein [Staphylococcus pseudintermedius]EGQ4248657.1 type IV secretory system conjugative DNA transfer family protein [Staphylococcus pseudintermedius]EHS7224427.1 type IV secretory system conjugative DNA transfer family protein [Staphylo